MFEFLVKNATSKAKALRRRAIRQPIPFPCVYSSESGFLITQQQKQNRETD
jgi:hypothetical protein